MSAFKSTLSTAPLPSTEQARIRALARISNSTSRTHTFRMVLGLGQMMEERTGSRMRAVKGTSWMLQQDAPGQCRASHGARVGR
eukprot:1625815-Rhodomonas_salina.2